MQGKGLIKFVLGLLIVVCAFQLFYFIPTRSVERDATEYAETSSSKLTGELQNNAFRDARARYLDSMSSETIFSIPGITKSTYSDLKGAQLALGLDLKGGMSTVIEVDLSELILALAGRNAKDVDLVAAINNAKNAQLAEQSNFISLFVREFKKIAPTRGLASIFQQSQTLGQINLDTPDSEVERLLRDKANSTVASTFERLKQRIDKLGVVQPNVSLDANRDLILVEMPGIDNPERARQYLQASAELGFWETFRFSDPGIKEAFSAADARSKNGTTDTTSVLDTLTNTQLGPLLSAITLNNAGEFGATAIGLVDKNKKNVVSEILARPDIQALFPKNLKFVWSYKPFESLSEEQKIEGARYALHLLKKQNNSEKAPIEGDVITKANQTLDQVSGQPQVVFAMNAQGAKKWADMTGRAYNEGQREIAIVLDNELVSAPGVNNGAITGGNSQISGNFTVQETQDLANILEVGKLPAKTRIIQESTIGPSLGKSNIQKSTLSLIISLLLVMAFMIFYYAKGGVVSVLALLLNILLIFGVLSSIGTVLTLPGIAGIVLTIGMAVDANVIIFERIREELREGKSLLSSVAEGFKQSYSAIIDANITTLLTAFVLAYFGLGPIKGFAVVLIVGVISSMFTAVVIGKLMIDGYIDEGKRDMSFWTSPTKDSMTGLNVNWMGMRKYAYIFSGALILISLISIFTRGFDLGVDFTGGHSYNVKFKEEVTSEQLRSGLEGVFGAMPTVKQIDGANSFNITTAFNINKNSQESDNEVTEKLYEGIKTLTNTTASVEVFKNNASNDDVTHITSYTKVGPTIADDIKKSSIWAGIFAIALIFLYILIRFSKWQYSAGAIIALIHDTVITIGMFSLLKGSLLGFSTEIDQAFIAAILTVIGYSINDTVIVYDRIREFFGLGKGATTEEVINNSINTTLSRTTITSFTTVFAVIVLLIFGGSSIKSFAFAISFGIFIGTYSSIFIASPIIKDLSKGDITIKKSVGTPRPVNS